MRRGATETEPEINGRKFRQLDQRNAKHHQQDKNRQHRRGVRRHELAVRQKSYRAGVIGTARVMMEIFVQRRADRHRGNEQPRSKKQTSNRRSGNPAGAKNFMLQLHFWNSQSIRCDSSTLKNYFASIFQMPFQFAGGFAISSVSGLWQGEASWLGIEGLSFAHSSKD